MNKLLSLLLTQTWQIAALAMIVAVVVKLAARNRPHLAHALWILVLIKCVTPPLWGHSLGVFSQMQTLIGHDSDESTFDAESIVALSVVPAEVTQSQKPVVVENALVPLTEFPPPQEDIANVPELDTEQSDIATNQESPIHQEFVSDDSSAQSAIVAWPSSMLWTLVFGAIATLLVTVVRCVRALRLIHRHHTTEFDDALNERLQQLATQLRIRRVPRIVVSDVLFGPAVLGLLRHTIVLPRCLMSKADSQLEAESENGKAEESQAAFSRLSAFRPPLSFLDPILAHELLHIRRGDLRFGMLQVIAQSLWWFHPAVWFSNRWLSREAERCCDEQVIAELGCSPGQYARSLLAVIESKHALQPIPVFPGMKPVEITTQRMERIMSLKTGLNKRTPLWCWLTVALLAIIMLPGAVANSLPEEVAQTAEANSADDAPTHPSASGQSDASDDTQFRATQNNPPSMTAVGISKTKPIGSRLADAVSPELEQIISDWTAASAKIDHLQGTVLRRIYDTILETESLSEGEFRFDSPQNWSFNFAPVKITESMIEHREQGKLPSKAGKNGQPFCLISCEAETWTRENRNLVEVNGKDGSTHRVELPADYQGGALIDRLLSIPLFTGAHTFAWRWNADPGETSAGVPGDSGTAHSLESQVKWVKQRFDISLLRPIEAKGKKAYLNILPRLDQDAAMWSSIQVILDLQTYLPSAVQIADPAETKISVYLYSRLNVNSNVCEFSNILPQGTAAAPVDAATGENAAVERVQSEQAEAPKFVICTYPVADLVVTGPLRLIPRKIYEKDAQTELDRKPSNADILRRDGISAQALPRTDDPQFVEVQKVDFAPIVELIKASVDPESWKNKGLIAGDIETTSIVVRQTVRAHEEIAELIMKLRNGQDANVQITSLLIKLTNEDQLNVIKEHNTLHSFADGMKWALLAPKRSETLTKALLDQKPETISSPRIMTISGQAAMIMVGSMDKSVFSGIKLAVMPQLVRDSSIIRLQHTVTICTDCQPNKTSGAKIDTDNFVMLAGQDLNNAASVFHESLVGSGQTLLLLIEQPRPDDDAKGVDRYVLMLTPESSGLRHSASS